MVKKVGIEGNAAWLAEMARSVAMIYTVGLLLSLTGAVTYFSGRMKKGFFLLYFTFTF